MKEVVEAEGKETSEPKVRNFLTLCLSGPEEKCRKVTPRITQLGFYPTGEKQDERHAGLWRFYFSMVLQS